jgi:hypothetical protein
MPRRRDRQEIDARSIDPGESLDYATTSSATATPIGDWGTYPTPGPTFIDSIAVENPLMTKEEIMGSLDLDLIAEKVLEIIKQKHAKAQPQKTKEYLELIL